MRAILSTGKKSLEIDGLNLSVKTVNVKAKKDCFELLGTRGKSSATLIFDAKELFKLYHALQEHEGVREIVQGQIGTLAG